MSVLKRRAELLAELIASTADLTPGHPRFEALARSCKEQIEFHSFLDTHPDVVDAEYAQLKERLEDNAQFDKVTALNILSNHLLHLDLASSQLDFSSRQLSFLLASSRNVLRTVVDPEILKSQDGTSTNKNTNHTAAGHPSEWSDNDEDNSDAEWWAHEVAYSPEDGLSVWSGDEDEEEQEEDAKEGTRGRGGTIEDGVSGTSFSPGRDNATKPLISNPTDSPLTPLTISRTAHRSPTTRESKYSQRQHVSPQRGLRQMYSSTSLSVWLAAKDSGGHPARQLDPRRCFTDSELVIQVR
jgi:hypothetical protein